MCLFLRQISLLIQKTQPKVEYSRQITREEGSKTAPQFMVLSLEVEIQAQNSNPYSKAAEIIISICSQSKLFNRLKTTTTASLNISSEKAL